MTKSKIIVTPESEIAFWQRKGVVYSHESEFRADEDHDRYTQAESRYRLVGRGHKTGKR